MITKRIKKYLMLLALVAALGWANNIMFGEPSQTDEPKSAVTEKTTRILSPQRRTHILYGDKTGGGHIYGANKPCKSEFPKNWDKDTIIKEIELIAANDNLSWKQQRNGYYVVEQKIDDVKIRVVKGRENKKIITAYPVNVRRNPCPRAANDN